LPVFPVRFWLPPGLSGNHAGQAEPTLYAYIIIAPGRTLFAALF